MELLFKYRTQVMALAILGVLCCHLAPLLGTFPPLRFGNMGVEMFFFISGVSIAHSWEKKPHLISYLKKRFLRIIPVYYITLILASLLCGAHLYSTKDYLLVNSVYWFIPSIIAAYLLFPLYTYSSRKISPYILIGVIIVATWLISVYSDGTADKVRMPVFFLGCFCIQNPHFFHSGRRWSILSFLGLTVLVLLYCTGQYEWGEQCGLVGILRPLITPGLCLIPAIIFHHLPSSACKKGILFILSLYGSLTLEIYLTNYPINIMIWKYLGAEYWLLSLILCIPFAFLLRILNSCLLRFFFSLHAPQRFCRK